MQATEKDFKVGQYWKTRNGKLIKIETTTGRSKVYPIESVEHSWTIYGELNQGEENPLDLVEQIVDLAATDEPSDKYTVEEVLFALNVVVGQNHMHYTFDVKKYFTITKDPEYQKYLELKAKFTAHFNI